MDIGTALIGGVLMAIFVLPIILISRGKKSREKSMLQSLARMAEEQRSKLGESEYCGDFAIGMDEAGSRVFFYWEINGKVVEQTVDLATVQACKLLNESRPNAKKGGTQKIIDRVGLSFTPAKASDQASVLEFYNAQVKMQLSGELQAAERWSKRINERLQTVSVA